MRRLPLLLLPLFPSVSPLPAQDLVPTYVRPVGSTLRTGQSGAIRVEVYNAGAVQVPAGWAISVVLSLDSVIGPEDPVVGSLPAPVALASGARRAFDVPVVLPVTIATAQYATGARLDAANAVSESNEGNNTLRGGLVGVVNEAPDLIISSGAPTVTPSAMVSGTPIAVPAWRTRNQGLTSAGAFTVGVYLSADTTITVSDILLGGASVSSLAAGAELLSSATGLVVPVATPPGTYYIGILADRGAAVTEAVEVNNYARSLPVTIHARTIDLVVVSGPPTLPASVPAGGSISAGNILVENRGTVEGLQSLMGIYLSADAVITPQDTRIGTIPVPLVAAGTQLNVTGPVSVSVPAAFSPGTYWFGLLADVGNQLLESNEGNNGLAWRQLVVLAPVNHVAMEGAPLTVTPQVFWPGQPVALSRFAVKILAVPIPRYWILGTYVSPDSIITSRDTRIRDTALWVTGPVILEYPNHTLPQGAAYPGNNYIGVLVHEVTGESLPDPVPGDNFLSARITILESAPTADLVVSDIAFGNWPQGSDSITVSYTFRNLGTGAVTTTDGSSFVRYSVCLSSDGITPVNPSCQTGGQVPRASLAGGTQFTASERLSLLPGEKYYLIVTADNLQRVPESNEGNNRLVSGKMLSRPQK